MLLCVFSLRWRSPLCAALAQVPKQLNFSRNHSSKSLVRDGNPGLVSRRKSSVVIVSPAARQLAAGGRLVFIVGVNNLSNVPLQFRVSDIQIVQTVNGQAASLKVITYEELVAEERTRQVFAALATGLAAAQMLTPPHRLAATIVHPPYTLRGAPSSKHSRL